MAALTTISSLLSTQHLEAAKLLEQKATQIIDPAFGQTSKQMLTQLPMVEMDEVQGVQRTQDLLRYSLASSLATQTARQRETSYALDCDALLESRALAHRITVRRASELGPVGGLGRNVEITLSLSLSVGGGRPPPTNSWKDGRSSTRPSIIACVAAWPRRRADCRKSARNGKRSAISAGFRRHWRKWIMP